jgi:hypothetical protein
MGLKNLITREFVQFVILVTISNWLIGIVAQLAKNTIRAQEKAEW